jgi:hypothetical protein
MSDVGRELMRGFVVGTGKRPQADGLKWRSAPFGLAWQSKRNEGVLVPDRIGIHAAHSD